MAPELQATPVPKWMLVLGWILGLLPAGLLVFSGVMKFIPSPQLTEGFTHLGWDENLAKALGVVELAAVALYLIPQTAVLGAVLLTGYMGGAIATHVRIGEPFYMQLALGVVLWCGLWLRDNRLRALLPVRR